MDYFDKRALYEYVEEHGWEAAEEWLKNSFNSAKDTYDQEQEKKKEAVEAAARRQTLEKDLLTAFNNYRRFYDTNVETALGEFIYLLDEVLANDTFDWGEDKDKVTAPTPHFRKNETSESNDSKSNKKCKCGCGVKSSTDPELRKLAEFMYDIFSYPPFYIKRWL